MQPGAVVVVAGASPRGRDDVLGRPLGVNDEVLAPRRPRRPEERSVERVVVLQRRASTRPLRPPAAARAPRDVTHASHRR